MKKTLRDYQEKCANEANMKLREFGMAYLAMQVRTGKTATSMEVCKLNGFKNVLFATRKKAMKSISEDYADFGYDMDFELTVINHESIHKIDGKYDCIIIDEAHRLGAFPKPSLVCKRIKKEYSKLPIIYLSGTPHPECLLQLFHQFWVSDRSIFGSSNFYKWHTAQGLKRYGFDLGYGMITNYNSNIDTMNKFYGIRRREIRKDDAISLDRLNNMLKVDKDDIEKAEANIIGMFNKIKVSFTQEEAGFSTKIKENVLYVDMKPSTYNVAKMLIRDSIVQGKEKVIIADSAVKIQSKLHQIFSGTVIFEDGTSAVIDSSKAIFIRDYFKGQKIAIFYKFKAEFAMLKTIFMENLTNDLDEFNSTDKNIALQIVSGREGISLKNAKSLVFINIDFSAVSYFQGIDRMTTMERLKNNVYWIFAKNGIEDKIYSTVNGKKNYTLSVFKRDYKL